MDNVLAASDRRQVVAQLRRADVAANARQAGVRIPLERLTGLVPLLARTCLSPVLRALLGAQVLMVRAVLFDKRPARNWSLGWHRDQTIAVAERIEVPGWGPWSRKAGVWHVQPPRSVMERLWSVRLHLDPCPAEAGALAIVAGSHRADWTEASGMTPTVLAVPVGAALIVSPLLLHGSGPVQGLRRRVLHLDCAGENLPAPLRWQGAIPLGDH